MNINELPAIDASDNPTGCCPRFDPEGWDGQELHFRDKRFVRVTTRSLFHFPLDMGRVFARTIAAIDTVGARAQDFFVLSRELSPWTAEHYFAVARDVPGQDMRRLSGDFLTRVFEGPYSDAAKWMRDLESLAAGRGKRLVTSYLFYTVCPRCAKHYGRNIVVGFAQVA